MNIIDTIVRNEFTEVSIGCKVIMDQWDLMKIFLFTLSGIRPVGLLNKVIHSNLLFNSMIALALTLTIKFKKDKAKQRQVQRLQQ